MILKKKTSFGAPVKIQRVPVAGASETTKPDSLSCSTRTPESRRPSSIWRNYATTVVAQHRDVQGGSFPVYQRGAGSCFSEDRLRRGQVLDIVDSAHPFVGWSGWKSSEDILPNTATRRRTLHQE